MRKRMEYFPIVLMLPLLWTNRNLALEDNSMQTEQNLYEESPAHTYIVEIAQAAGFSSNYSQEQMASLHFSLLPSSEHGDFFTVNPSSGALRTAQIIDRDDPELCAARVTCVLRLDIGIQIDGDFLLYKVFVNILDRNDNAPNFLQNSFSRSIAENTPPGASFSIPAAEDLDSPRFGVKDYALIEGAPQFELKKVNNSEGNLDIYLVLREELDHEVRNHYEALVAAYDGGVQPNIGRLPIDIVVEDVNDNHPYFEVENYQVRVPEDLEVGSLVTQVSAWDDDSGANGQIVYGFTVKTERSYGSIFAINNHTGTITVKSPLDYESHPTYNLAVTARDVNPDSLAATALVVVEVEDVNDHVPLITVSALTTSGNLQVAEDQAVGTFVAFVAVSDPDSGANGQFSCHLEGQAFAIEQLQDSSQFKLITSVELDRETLAHYDVSFVCQDGGIPSRSSTALIGITVLDINDHAPVFSKQLYSAQVTENNRLEEFIIKVEASDADAGDNGLIEYSVEGSGNMYISISPSTGDITARVSYDYEESPMMEFTLLVVDHGSPPRNGTAMLRINLRDLDDNIPTFGNHFYSLDIYENLPIGSTVGQVFASDADSAAFNQFTYGLVPGQSDYDPFQVHPDTGLIVTTQRLDRETTAFYEFLLTAVSSHNVSQSSLVTVRVDVADKNDNSPYLLFPTEHNNSLTIPSALNIGSEVGHIVARDEDIGINAQLAYMLMDGLQNYYFDLDYNTGVIRVKSSLRSVENSVVQLRILVRDHGQPYYQINEWLNIAVNKTLLVPLSNHNLTIVIAVVTVSGLLTVLLVAAIIITKRLDQRKQSNRYMPRLCPDSTNLVFMDGKTCSHENSLQDEGLKTAMYDASFTNEVLIEEAGMFRAPGHVSVEDKSASIRIQGVIGCPGSVSHTGQPSAPPASYNLVNPASLTASQPSGQRYAMQIHPVLNKDNDSDSTHSATMSTSDSGRGSNDDTTESRRSPVPNDFYSQLHKGVVTIQPPQSSSRPPQTPARDYKVQLAPSHRSASDTRKPFPSISGQPERRPPPPVIVSRPSSAPHVEARKNDTSKNFNHYSSSKVRCEGLAGPKSMSFELQRGGVCDSSGSEEEASDEDQEYVYYVNASHV